MQKNNFNSESDGLAAPFLSQNGVDITFEEHNCTADEDKENQSQNVVIPQSLQMIKADLQAKDAKALLGMMKRSNSGKSPQSGTRAHES